jgi:transglutaminase-like putative cysteine protease
VLAVEWVADDGIVVPAAVLGLGMGMGLAQRPLRTWAAWLFIVLYGLLWTAVTTGNLWPPLTILRAGWGELRLYWLNQGALLLDRTGGWFQAVLAGNSSQETIVFVGGLGLLAWLLAAYAGWSAWRQKRPLLGLSLMGVAVAVNSYFGAEAIYWTAAFISMAGLTTAVMHYTNLEQQWQLSQVDYSPEIRTDLTAYAALISAGLLVLALLLPAFSISRLADFFLRQEAVQQAEQALTRAFAGVRQPAIRGALPGDAGSTGVLPRSYLLGNAPELHETVVMTAVVTPQPPANVTHWRALSYDVYTGRGWAVSEERQEDFAANSELPLPATIGQSVIEQSVHWLLDERVIRYTLGQPRQFDQDVVASWRGLTDLVRVQSDQGSPYRVISQVTTATAAELQAATGEIPAVIRGRYTQLPEDLPERIRELAQEVAGDEATAYEQALALERFLRQYSYSLDIDLPPRDADPVDFFLFGQQVGYCDYFASAMTVMARSLGLPARLAVGYLAQAPDEAGVQTIREINSHSWTEIYFAEYGWVEFEPTAVFASNRTEIFDPAGQMVEESDVGLPAIEPPPIPEPELPLPVGRLVVLGILGLALLGWWWWQRATALSAPGVVAVYGRLQKQARYFDQPVPASQTPGEFAAEFQARLAEFGRYVRLKEMVATIQGQVKELAQMFNARQYGQAKSGDEVALRIWRDVKRPLWFLRLIWLWLRHQE